MLRTLDSTARETPSTFVIKTFATKLILLDEPSRISIGPRPEFLTSLGEPETEIFIYSRPPDPFLGRSGRRPGDPGMATPNKFATKSAEATSCVKIFLDAPGIPEARQEFQSSVKNFRAES